MEYEKEDIALFTAIDKEIQELTDKQIVAFYKNSQKVDEKAIREENKKAFFQSLAANLDHFLFQHLKSFWEQLQVDDSALYNKLTKNTLDVEKANTLDYITLKNIRAQVLKKFDPESIDKLMEIAESFFTSENFEKARIYFVFLACLKPSDPYTWLMKGLTEQGCKKYDEALLSYLSAVNIDSNYFLSYFQIVECLLLTDKKQEAAHLFEEIKKQVSEQGLIKAPLYATKIQALEKTL